MLTAYVYIRVATQRQIRHGHSPETQRETLARYCEFRLKDKGLTLGRCFEDKAVSGKRPLRSRPEGR